MNNQEFYKNICSFNQYYLSPTVKKIIAKSLLQYKQAMNKSVTKILVTEVNELKTEVNELKTEVNELKKQNQELKTKFNKFYKYASLLEDLFAKQNTNPIDKDNSVDLLGEGEE
jgi:FtsZ-binding cell division protein ZapB